MTATKSLFCFFSSVIATGVTININILNININPAYSNFNSKGIIEKNMKLAFKYYNNAIDSNIRTLCFYAYYNLAKYYYSCGYTELGIKKDKNKANEYFEVARKNGIHI